MKHPIKSILLSIATLLSIFLQSVSAQEVAGDEYFKKAEEIWSAIDKKQGKIELKNKVTTLNVPEGFIYINPVDAGKVLVNIWGNPPSQSDKLDGMLLPSDVAPFEQGSWAVTISYEEDGYVSDEEADEINYDDLLKTMKENTEENNAERKKQGYEGISLVGWASKPYYDKQSHKLHWAKELKFSSQETNTLNYDIRILGRKGVLVLSFIAGIEQKEVINSKIDAVANIANFNDGSKYSDFNPSMDKVAAYGIGALIAGKVAAKTGLLVVLLLFLKKFGIYLLIAGGGLLKVILGRKKD